MLKRRAAVVTSTVVTERLITLPCKQGFMYISSVADENTPGVASTRSGLLALYAVGVGAPESSSSHGWGATRCSPGPSRPRATSGPLTPCRSASCCRCAVTIGFLMWEDLSVASLLGSAGASGPSAAAVMQAARWLTTTRHHYGDGPEIVLRKDSNDCSFRFQHIGLPHRRTAGCEHVIFFGARSSLDNPMPMLPRVRKVIFLFSTLVIITRTMIIYYFII